jgi:hypothetical protein
MGPLFVNAQSGQPMAQVTLSSQFLHAAGTISRAPSDASVAGAAAVNVILIGSSAYRAWSPHFNVACAASGSGDVVTFTSHDETLSLVQLGVGGKFNVTGNFLINASVLIGLTSSGVNAPFTPVVGFGDSS